MIFGQSNLNFRIWIIAFLAAVFGIPLILLDAPEIYIAAVSFCSLCLIVKQINDSGFFNPLSLFVITAAPYIIASPIDILIFGNWASLAPTSIAFQSMYGLIFILFTLAFSRTKLLSTHQIKIVRRFEFDISNILTVAIAATNTFLVATFFSLEIGSLSRHEIYSQKPVIYDLFKLVSQCTIIFILWQSLFIHKIPLHKLRLSFAAISVVLLSDVIIVGDRRMAVVISMVVGYYYSINHNIPRWTWILISTLALLLLAYGGFRNLPPSAWIDIYSGMDFLKFLNPMNLEFGAFPRIWTDMVTENIPPIKATYLQAIPQIIPSALIADRPLPPSVEYVRIFHPDIYNIGGGMAFNALVESLMNFGHAGPAVIGVLYGLIFSRNNSTQPTAILLSAIFIYCLSFTLRNDFTSTIRFLIIATATCSILLVMFNRATIVKFNP